HQLVMPPRRRRQPVVVFISVHGAVRVAVRGDDRRGDGVRAVIDAYEAVVRCIRVLFSGGGIDGDLAVVQTRRGIGAIRLVGRDDRRGAGGVRPVLVAQRRGRGGTAGRSPRAGVG